MSTARVIKPVLVTDEVLISSNVPETDYAEWNSGTSYSVGSRVIRTSSHKIYEAVLGGVDSTPPEQAIGLATPRWIEVGPTNRWSMFDQHVSTETAMSGAIVIVLRPGIVDSLGLVGLYGSRVTATMTHNGEAVWTDTKNLDGTELTGWYDYWYKGFDQVTQAVFNNLPPYVNGEITVTIEGDGTVSCGAFLVGSSYAIGKVRVNPTIELTDYSVKSTDEYGITKFVQRQHARRLEVGIIISADRVDAAFDLVASVWGPALWVMHDDDKRLRIMTVYGWRALLTVTLPYIDYSLCTLQVQGLT
jgi:hypothetical protein